MKNKVLFILQNLNGGGAERVTLNLIRNLDRNRYHPSLILIEKKGAYLSDIPEDIDVYYLSERLGYNKYFFPYYIIRIASIARDYDIVVGCMELRVTYLAYYGGRLARKAVVGWVHILLDRLLDSGMRKKHRKLVRKIYPKLDRVVCVSKDVAQSLRNCFTNSHDVDPIVVYNVHDLENIVQAGGISLPKKYEVIFQRPTIIAVGRLMPPKRYDLLIKAFADLRKDMPKVHLCIVGSGYLEEELKKIITELGLVGVVYLLGYVNNPYPLIRNASVLAISSDFEGLPGVAVEAMVLGVPVVGSACEGTAELITDEHNGLLVPVGDYYAMSTSIKRVLTDQALAEKLKINGKIKAKEFSAESNIPRWDEILSPVMGETLQKD